MCCIWCDGAICNIVYNNESDQSVTNQSAIRRLVALPNNTVYKKQRWKDNEMKNELQTALNRLSQWAFKWKITFSMDKTKLVVFQPLPSTSRLPYISYNNQFTICNQPIEPRSAFTSTPKMERSRTIYYKESDIQLHVD